MTDLNKGVIRQGDGAPKYFEVEFTNLSSLASDHPLKAQGFLTSGYTIRFTVKRKPSDTAVLFSKSSGAGVTVSSSTIAYADLSPADTRELDISTLLNVHYDWQIAKNDGTEVYTMETGEFQITSDVGVTAP